MNEAFETEPTSRRDRVIAALGAAPVGSRPLGLREALLAALGLGLLTLAMYLPHVLNGGWYLDDWIMIAQLRDGDDAGGLLEVYRQARDISYRPGYAIVLTALYAVGQDGQAGYLLAGLLCTALQASLFFVVLRTLRLRTVVAIAASVLLIVLPVIDSTRLWMAAFPITVASIFFLVGLLLVLWATQAETSRRRWPLYVGGAAMLAVSIVTYEMVAGLVAVTPLLYLLHLGWRRCLLPSAVSWLGFAVGMAIMIPRADARREAESALGVLIDRAEGTWVAAAEVFRSLVPWSDVLAGPLGLALAFAGAIGAGVAIGGRGPYAETFRQWTLIGVAGLLVALAGLVMLLPADAYFVPRFTGMGNRTGTFAAFGAVVLLLALIVVTFGGIAVLLKRPRAGFAVAALLVVVAAVELGVREVRQQQPWADAWVQQQKIVSAVRDALGPRLPPHSSVVSFRHTQFLQPDDVSVFAYSWDLRGAVWHAYDDPTLVARPWNASATCAARSLAFPDDETPATGDGAIPYGYGRLYFVDAAGRTAHRVSSRAQCEKLAAALAAP